MQRSQVTHKNGRLIESVPDPFFAIAHQPLCLLDNHGRVVDVNEAFTRLSGYGYRDAAGIAFLEWVHPEERRVTVAALGAAVAHQQTTTFRARLQGREGDYQELEWTVTGSSGRLFLAGRELPPAERGSASPVTAAELVELLESAPDVIGLANAEGRTLYLNRAGREVLGFGPADDLWHVHISSYVTETERARIAREGLPVAAKEGIWTGETVLRSTRGAELPVSLVIMAHKDQQGRVRRLSAIARDIRDRRRVEEALSRQAADMETVARISMATATLLDTERLLQEVVDITRERFNLYHAHIYLLNAAGDALELAAGAGDVGREMIAQGRRIRLTQENALVAQAARSRQSRTANDVRREEGFPHHPLLPQTRSEMAVPMIFGEQLIGVLDLLDDTVGRFDDVDAHIFATLAAQTAVALENARSFARAQEAIAESSALMRLLTREGWEGYLAQQTGTRGFLFDAGRAAPLVPLDGSTAPPAEDQDALVAQPLEVHDEVIGRLALFAGDGEPDDEAVELVAAIAQQLSARLENLRLTGATQMALTETASLYRAGSDLNRANTYDEVLDVLRRHSVVGRDAASAIVLFERPWTPEQKPERFAVAAYFAAFDLSPETMQRVAPPLFGMAGELLRPDSPTFIADIEQENALPSAVRRFYAEELQSKSALFVPLALGGQWIGYLTAAYPERAVIAEADMQRLTTLAGQAAAAVQSIYLLQAAEERARQERVLRELSARVRNVTDIDLIMKTAVREIGQVLGRETFLYLGDDEAPAPQHGENRGPENG